VSYVGNGGEHACFTFNFCSSSDFCSSSCLHPLPVMVESTDQNVGNFCSSSCVGNGDKLSDFLVRKNHLDIWYAFRLKHINTPLQPSFLVCFG
jgi:hypothetical protein